MWVSLGFLLLSGNVLLLVRAIDVEAHAAHINIGMADETRISILIKCQVPVSLVPEVMVVEQSFETGHSTVFVPATTAALGDAEHYGCLPKIRLKYFSYV